MKSCTSCVSFVAGGCVHPMSTAGFEDEPEPCDLHYPREAPANNPGLLPVKRPVLPAAEPTAEEREFRQNLYRIQSEHSRYDWRERGVR